MGQDVLSLVPDKDRNSISSMRAPAERFTSYELMYSDRPAGLLIYLSESLPLRANNKTRTSGSLLMIHPLTSFPADWKGSCGESRATCPFSLPRSTRAVRPPLLTTHWKDLAADQSITVVINSDADCFPLMRWGEQQAGQ